MKKFTGFIIAFIGFALMILTLKGATQQVVQFSGTLNELGFAVVSMWIGMLGLISVDYKNLLKK